MRSDNIVWTLVLVDAAAVLHARARSLPVPLTMYVRCVAGAGRQ